MLSSLYRAWQNLHSQERCYFQFPVSLISGKAIFFIKRHLNENVLSKYIFFKKERVIFWKTENLHLKHSGISLSCSETDVKI